MGERAVPDEHRMAAFRPYRTPRVALACGVVFLAGAIAMAIGLPERFGFGERFLVVFLGLGVGWLMLRYARISAVPGPEGLRVRNLGREEMVPWAAMEAVRYGDGMPWPTVDLADGDQMSVMAIQRADGPSSQLEALRLAELIAEPPR